MFDASPEYDEEALPTRHPWRRWVIWGVAAVLVTILVAGPIWGAVQRSRPQFADNGLQLCAFDYCDVQRGVIEAGFGPTMARLAGIRLTSDEARQLATDLVALMGAGRVTVEVVDALPGDVAGRYDTRRRVIEVEEPIVAWTIVHEVAHVAEGGHDAAYQEALLDLVRRLEAR